MKSQVSRFALVVYQVAVLSMPSRAASPRVGPNPKTLEWLAGRGAGAATGLTTLGDSCDYGCGWGTIQLHHGFASFIPGNRLLYRVWESFAGRDLNGDGDVADAVLHVMDLSTGEATSLGFAGAYSFQHISGEWIAFNVDEGQQGQDLNADGDLDDDVFHAYDLASGTTQNSGLATWSGVLPVEAGGEVPSAWVIVGVREESQGMDLDGNGDLQDVVPHLYDVASGEVRNLGFSQGVHRPLMVKGWLLFVGSVEWRDDVRWGSLFLHEVVTGRTIDLGIVREQDQLALGDDWVLYAKPESVSGLDLNGDGDLEDAVLHLRRLSTGETTNLGLAGRPGLVRDHWLVFGVSEEGQGQDLNADGFVRGYVAFARDLETGESWNLGHGIYSSFYGGGWLRLSEDTLYSVSESSMYADDLVARETRDLGVHFHGEGGTGILTSRWFVFDDDPDHVLHALDFETGFVTRLGPYTHWNPDVWGETVRLAGNWLLYTIVEADEGRDLNDDGDFEDYVFEARDLASGRTVNSRLAAYSGLQPFFFPWGAGASQTRAVFTVSEPAEGARDLNGDGDAEDAVIHVLDLQTGATANLGVAGMPVVELTSSNVGNLATYGEFSLVAAHEGSQGRDLNGDGDLQDLVLLLLDLRTPIASTQFVRADANSDGNLDLSDPVATLGYLFLGTEDLLCFDAADADDSGEVDISDAIYSLTFQFLGGPSPPAPFPGCGTDPTEDALECEGFAPCQ